MQSAEETVCTKAIVCAGGHGDEVSADSVVASVLDLCESERATRLSVMKHVGAERREIKEETHIMAHFYR